MDADLPRKEPVMSDQAAENITRVEELAYELKIDAVMTRNMRVLSPEMKMRDVLETLRQAHISGAPVALNGQLVGVLSIEDLIRCLVANDLDNAVQNYMTTKVISISSRETVIEALKTFVSLRIGRLPVVSDDGRLVGILTKGDITRGLLKALQHDYQEEEVRRYRASHLFEDIVSDRTSLILRYTIKPRDFTRGGTASAHIKRALLRLGASPQIARRCGIAIYEAEMNLIIHTTNGGILRVEIEPHQITINASDDGPGIANVDLAMKPGYSTASEQIRELGFGAGMGLVNIQRCVDSMKIESVIDKGTRLTMRIFLSQEDQFGELTPQPSKEHA